MLPDSATELGNGLADLGPVPPDLETGPPPAIEAISLSKVYKPQSAVELKLIPWRTRPRKRPEPDNSLLDTIGDDDDDGFDDDDDFDLDDDDDTPVEEPAEQPTLTDGEIWALRDVSFTLAPGRALGVLGADGAGKSTLLKILNRITSPTTGHAIVRGRVAPSYSVALSFISARQSGVRSIFRLARFFAIPQSVAESAVEPIRELTELGDLLELPTRTYSTGQLARLAYGISLCLDPDIVLLDGLPSVGDPAYRRRAHAALEERIDQGLTVVVATNDLGHLRGMCTEALLLKAGRVEAFGSTAEVASQYEAESAAKAADRARASPKRAAQQPTAEVVVNTAAVYDMRGQPMATMRETDDALFEMTVEVRTVPKRLRCVVALIADGALALRSIQPEPYDIHEPGVYAASVHWPPGTVPPGKYDGKARLLELVDEERRALDQADFDLISLSTDEAPPQRVRPSSLEWDMVRLS